jgi:hypothetical protein
MILAADVGKKKSQIARDSNHPLHLF